MARNALNLLDVARLRQIPIVIPHWKGSHPFSKGESVRKYRREDLKMKATVKQPRTDFFEKTLVGIWTAIGEPVPYAFRTIDGEVRSLDAGCLGFLINAIPPSLSIRTDANGFITTVEPTGPLLTRYQRIADRLAAQVQWPSLSERLPAAMLDKVTAQHILNAVHSLLAGAAIHSFGDSTDFDVICDNGQRLPPKAVFGVAASEALGFDVQPKHFTGGLGTPCFKAIETAGFEIVAKGHEGVSEADALIVEEWKEGGRRLTVHLKAERARGLVPAKKASFVQQHGRLFCERCKRDPVEEYGPELGDACIEVHHQAVSVADMREKHITRLDDLICLCANCHRVTHRELRLQAIQDRR